MAASLFLRRATSKVLKGVLKPCSTSLSFCNRRYLLSQAYGCKEAWKKRLEDPVLNQIPLSEFAIQLRDQYEKEKVISGVDMEILANKLHEMDVDEAEFMEDLMIKFRKCPDANPVRDSVVYVTVRSYLDKSLAERLLPLLQSRSTTGLFPDPIAFSLLLDHFIQDGEFASAALVAYELMLQEDFTHPTSRLLALYAAVHHLENASLDELTPEEIQDPTGEEEWVPVKYIRYPTYDDHFDIASQQHLLGKTLWSLGKTVKDESGPLSNSLKVGGLALYHKFGPCLDLLSEIAAAGKEGGAVVEDCLLVVAQCLERVQIRDPDKPEKEFGLMRIEDEMYKLLPTQQEREKFQDRLQELTTMLQEQGQVTQDKLSALVSDMVTSQLPQHEAEDIKVQTSNLERWRGERGRLVEDQLQELEKRRKVQEIQATLKDLQDKEEMVRFFDLYDKVRLTQPKKEVKVKEAAGEEEDEEILRAKRIKRRKYRHNV